MIRAITAVVLGALVVSAVWFLPVSGFNLLIFVIALFGLTEYSRMFHSDRVEALFTFSSGAILAAVMLLQGSFASTLAVVLAGLVFALSLLFMWRANELPSVADRLGVAVFGMLYLGLIFPFWGWVRTMPMGRELVLLALVPACLCDTFAYVAGKSFGKRKFSPLVSPNKTWEGFAGALAGSIVGTFIVRQLLWTELPVIHALGFACMIWIISPMGDLIESMLKRSVGVKDSGSVIPGHGGVLDRLDALIFTAPAVFAFARFVLGI